MFNNPPQRLRWVFECPSLTEVAQQSVAEFLAITFINLNTPKSAAKCELLFPSCLAAALGVTKFIANIIMNSFKLYVLHKSDLDVPQIHPSLLNILVRLKEHNKLSPSS
jgi:hypothetical protein